MNFSIYTLNWSITELAKFNIFTFYLQPVEREANANQCIWFSYEICKAISKYSIFISLI